MMFPTICKPIEKTAIIREFESAVAAKQQEAWALNRPFDFEVIIDPIAGSTTAKGALVFFAILSACLLVACLIAFSNANPSSGWALLLTGGGLSFATIAGGIYLRRRCELFHKQVHTLIDGCSDTIAEQYVKLQDGTGNVSDGGLFISYTKELSGGVLRFTDVKSRNDANISTSVSHHFTQREFVALLSRFDTSSESD